MDFDELATKYRGPVASGYETKRLDRKWAAEQEAAEVLLRRVPPGSKVLDVPVGTGRLIPILASSGLQITGMDASGDMIQEAYKSAERVGAQVDLRVGDIRELPFSNGAFDLAACLRFLNWIDMEGVSRVLAELTRVSSDKLLIGVRYLTPTSEMTLSAHDVTLRLARLFGLPSLRVRRWGMVLHHRAILERLFEQLHLSVLDQRLVERRSDSTDYVFYLLGKQKPEPVRTGWMESGR